MSEPSVPLDPGSLRARLAENLPLSLWSHWRAVAACLALLVAVVAWAIDARGGVIGSGPPPESTLPRAATQDAAPPTTVKPPSVLVQVTGAVVSPGVVDLGGDARVRDAVDAAGGLSPEADLERINLAAKVSDGQRIYVLKRGQAAAPDAAAPQSPTGEGESSGPVDLNAATEEALDKLPGVGPATAKAIVDYRKSHGPFRAVGDLAKVKGIGPAKLDQIRPLVRV